MKKIKTLIMGAAGRDFHNFNVIYRDNELYDVVAFTATQIPNIDGRKYPAELAGKLYPNGIPIHPESDFAKLIKEHNVDEVVFSYSDVSNQYIMSKASDVMACGAAFKVLGAEQTMVKSTKPVVAVVAIRTGCGKSQTSRKVSEVIRSKGKKVAIIRHPMPYGNLVEQKVQRFASIDDLKKHKCTIEEMEEYEPHIINGCIVYAGVDYEAILRDAEKEADVIIWDGGNNDMPFYKPNLVITVVDPLRAGHETTYYPGAVNLRIADVIVINKIDSATPQEVEILRKNIEEFNPKAVVVDAASPISVEGYKDIKGKKVLIVEDGPTLTHGEMKIGAGWVAAKKYGAAEIVDPRPYTVGTITETFKKYPNIGIILPAMGYSDQQVEDLEKTINKTECDLVIIATPIDLRRICKIKHKSVRVEYYLNEIGKPDIKDVLEPLFK